jgi:hypothetical protein
MFSLLLVLGVFGFSSIAFYVSLNAYVIDQQHRKAIDGKVSVYKALLNHTLVAQESQAAIASKKAKIESLTLTCTNERTLIGMVSVPESRDECTETLDALNRTLQQLTATPTIQLLRSGGCQFVSDNSTGLTDYVYQKVSYNGAEFYYYEFETSSNIWTTNGTVAVRNCVPAILSGGTMKRGYKDGLVPDGGVDHMLIGAGEIRLVFNVGNKNVRLNQFQIWAEGV